MTAASYPQEPAKFETRLQGLLGSLAYALDCGAPSSFLNRFHLIGGQCNYAYKLAVSWGDADAGPRVHLVEIPPEQWKPHRGVRWDHDKVQELLNVAEESLRDTAERLNLDILLIRKERAVGIVSRSAATRLSYEALEEGALAVQSAVVQAGLAGIPHCSFNGGRDCFLDVGQKALGIRALQGMLGIAPAQTVHLGDRFTQTGNDRAARDVANTLWVTSPVETESLLTLLQQRLREAGRLPLRRAAADGADLSSASPMYAASMASPVQEAVELPARVVATPVAAAEQDAEKAVMQFASSEAALDVLQARDAHVGDMVTRAGGSASYLSAAADKPQLSIALPPAGAPLSSTHGMVGPGIGSPRGGQPQLHPMHTAGSGGLHSHSGPSPILPSEADSGISAAWHGSGGFGLRGSKEGEVRLAEQLRSQWTASGGRVVADLPRGQKQPHKGKQGEGGHGAAK